MKINSVDNKTNFGWKCATHIQATNLAVENVPRLKKYKDILTKYVLKPDFDERGFKGNTHFYYPPQLWRPSESFMDLTGSQNALAKYEKHMYEFDRFLNKDIDKSMEHAGRALHFLQDVTQPQHVHRSNIFQIWRNKDVHKDFENYAYQYQDYFLKNARPLELDVTRGDYFDLFDEAVSISEMAAPASRDNTDMWIYIAQDGITNLLAVTKEFCRNIINALD